uniref:ABC transporter permease n=1 Tax=Flavobacterium sp. TaxID=239 RepID=UPI00404BA352
MNEVHQSLNALALQRFKKNLWGVFSFYFILILSVISIFGYLIAPDATTNANQMHLSIHSKSPGFEAKLLLVPQSDEKAPSFLTRMISGNPNPVVSIPIASYDFQDDVLVYQEYNNDPTIKQIKQIPIASFGNATTQQAIETSFIVQKTFWLGTDKYGRDLLSRMIIGSRVSLSVGFIAVFISLIVGLFFGALGGYFGGKVDAFVMWLVNIIWSIPTLLLVIAITLALGKGFWQVFVAVGLTMWVEVARVVRGQVISLKQMQYVTAARALGFSDFRIIFKHILPNALAPIIVISAANFASAVLIESGLSFLGLGAQPPTPSWGGIIKDHYNYIVLGKPYLALVPGIAIMFLTLAFMLIGNALRDAFDVKS